MSEYIRLGSLSDFPEGTIRGFAILGDQVAVVRSGAILRAFTNYCTHEYCTHEAVSLSDGYGVVDENNVDCMLHSSVFEISTGKPIQGPAYDPLTIYDVKLEGDDVLVGPS